MKLVKIILFLTIISAGTGMAKAQQRGLDYAITTVIRDYFEVKNALTAGNANLVKNKAGKMIWDLNNVPTKDMNSLQHTAWFSYLSRLQLPARSISEQSAIANQRKQFSALSNTLYNTLKDMKANSMVIYRQYSAASDSYWLNDGPAVRNPYYGIADKKMGREGVTKDILPAISVKK
ncbi:DUF3347 domain-containing protein [Mucilaginibacter antarcticus]|uniref:DUF3347 domain-containing protein n=1 Tax=Mucilaginibacter antarcticus TaxID=1855725 RepID=A0ABW5XJS9_9SPHI